MDGGYPMDSGKLNRVLPAVFVLTAIFVISCSTSMEPVVPLESGPELTMEQIQDQSENYVDITLKLSASALTDMEKVKEQRLDNELDIIKNETYRYHRGYHIWKGYIEDAAWGDALDIKYVRKLMFIGPDGKPQESFSGATRMYFSSWRRSKFGFIDHTGHGDEHKYVLRGSWNNLLTHPTLNGKGIYKLRWAGLYNNKDVVLNYIFRIGIKDLQFVFNDSSYDVYGIIIIQSRPYTAIATCNGSNIATVEVYKRRKLINTFEYTIPNLYQWTLGNGM
jgi:hypothetical protein